MDGWTYKQARISEIKTFVRIHVNDLLYPKRPRAVTIMFKKTLEQGNKHVFLILV